MTSPLQESPESQAEQGGLRPYGIEAVLGLALVVLVIFAFGNVVYCDFVNWDDGPYVKQNLSVLGGLGIEGIAWAFTSTVSNHWHPLTWMSLQLDAEFYGERAEGYHLTNLLLHLANVLLVFAILRGATGAIGRSAVVSGLFAVHPLHVESVAWVTERKDVLSTFFWLLTTAAYVYYARRPDWRRFVWIHVFFVLGLLAKPMLITLPFTLLLLDWWPLQRFGAADPEGENGTPRFARAPVEDLVREKVLMVVLAIVSGVGSLIAREQGGGLKSGEYLDFGERLGYAVCAAVGYPGKMIWPANLAPYYPLTPGGLPLWRVLGSAAVLIAVTLVVLTIGRRKRYLTVGWLWYLGTLFPVSGVVQLGSYAMADRYTYVPLIGIFIAVVWGTADFLPGLARSRLLAPVAAVLLVVLAVVSRQQVRHWSDSVSLWEHTLAVTPENFVSRTQMGNAYQTAQRFDEAEEEFQAAIRLRPDLAIAHYHLGLLYSSQGELAKAAACFTEAVERQPTNPQFRIQLGNALLKQGKREAAEKEFRAVRVAPRP
jgi:hypothetical protein